MKRTACALTTVAAILLTALVPAPAHADRSAAVLRCTPFVPAPGFYEAGRVATALLTVPANPACTTISVSRIQDPANPSDRCQTFLVGFFPADGGEATYTEPVDACSHRLGLRPTVLARNVPDGTRYRVLYEIDYFQQHVTFTLRH